jgi:hypothetical protein
MKWICLLLLTPAVWAESYDQKNHPQNFSAIAGAEIILQLNDLPLRGRLFDSRLGWSESYWPANIGSIAYRWNHPDPQPFTYRLYTKEELQALPREDMDQLSPAELYDIAMGDYNYTLTRSTLSRFSPRALWWEGLCHGWAQAASHYPEPAPVIITNPDQIKVPFGSSDVKALLAMHDSYNFRGGNFAFLGRRCRIKGKVPGEGDERDSFRDPPAPELANSPECRDVNAGGFHVVLANMIGIHGKGFVADIDRFNDVWNQPVTGYESEIIGEEAINLAHQAQGIHRRVRIRTRMIYGEELKFKTPELEAQGLLNFVSKFPVTLTPAQEFRAKDYQYIVEVNQEGEVIGGEWLTETRPDFLWMYQRHLHFQNEPVPLAGLRFIYRPLRR